MLNIFITMNNKTVAIQPEETEANNMEFYLMLITIKLGLLSGMKIIKSVINGYKSQRNALKKKYTSEVA